MADQVRYRSQQREPSSAPASSSGAKGRFSPQGEDPLAELARLIGQDDPFTDFRDDPRRGNGRARRSDQPRDDRDDRDAYDREPREPSRARRFADDDPRYAEPR